MIANQNTACRVRAACSFVFALIAAEIDRSDRASACTDEGGHRG